MRTENDNITQRSGSRVVIDALLNAGVHTVFGYPGGAIMPLYDALLDAPIRHELTRHEQGAIHAADGFARASGKMGVCLATSGPGATNLVTGMCTAQMDSVPVLCLTGQVATPLIGTDGFQEADVIAVATSVTKHAYLVRTVDELPHVMAEAIHVATSGRPGPVLVDIPKDVLIGTTTRSFSGPMRLAGYDPQPKMDKSDLKQAHAALKQAKRPVCIVGGGCRISGAWEEFRQWCAATDIPVITTLHGIGSTAQDYPGWLGMPGMHGHRRANRAITECDMIVALGMRFDDRVTGKLEAFAPHARIIHADIDPAEIGKLVNVDAALHGDLKDILSQWLSLMDSDAAPSFSAWQTEAMAVGDGLEPPRQAAEGSVPPTLLLNRLFATAGPDCIFTTDVGQHQMWAAQRVRPSNPRKWITSGGAGTMGYGMPAAMGAQFACPESTVISISGDGGFQMTMAELATVARCGLPLKILVMDNKFLGMVRQWQDLFFKKRYSGVDLSDNPDFAALARVYGLEAFTLRSEDAIDETIAAWLGCEGPALLHAMCQLEENVFPMVPAGKGLADMVESA